MGMYELVFVVIMIILVTYMWIGLGYFLKSTSDIMAGMPRSDAYSDWGKPIDWGMTAFYIFLFFVSLLAIFWAVKS